MDSLDKFIPFSPEAEEAVIGALLVDSDALRKVAQQLDSSDFFQAELGHIYRAICTLYSEETPVDLLTVKATLTELGLLGEKESQVGVPRLLKLMGRTPHALHVEHYAKQVREWSLRRKLMQQGTSLIQRACDLTTSPGQTLADHSTQQEKLSHWFNGDKQDYFLPHEETYSLDEFEAREESARADDSKIQLGFGWMALDGDPWDYQPPLMLVLSSTLTGIGADTGVGKTIVASQMVDWNAKKKKAKFLFLHNELQGQQMKFRRICRLSGVPFHKLVRPDFQTDEDRQAIARAAAEIHSWPGRVDFVHCPGWDGRRVAEEIKIRQSTMIAATGKGYDGFVVDYLNRMGRGRTLHNGASKVEEVTYNLQALGDVANELDIAGIYTYQLRRESGDGAAFVKPTLHNGLDCGNIERFTNQLLGVWRDRDEPENAQFIILKSTFSEPGRVEPVVFVPGRYEFQ